MVIKAKKMKLTEEWLNDEKTMIITSSAIEVKDRLVLAKHMMRVLCDGIINKYMICDGYSNIHTDMIVAALENYYYPFKNGFMNSGVHKVQKDPSNVFISYVPKDAKEAADIDELRVNMTTDSYTTQYTYENGYVFSQEKPGNRKFSDTELFKVLGKCLAVEELEDNSPLIYK